MPDLIRHPKRYKIVDSGLCQNDDSKRIRTFHETSFIQYGDTIFYLLFSGGEAGTS